MLFLDKADYGGEMMATLPGVLDEMGMGMGMGMGRGRGMGMGMGSWAGMGYKG